MKSVQVVVYNNSGSVRMNKSIAIPLPTTEALFRLCSICKVGSSYVNTESRTALPPQLDKPVVQHSFYPFYRTTTGEAEGDALALPVTVVVALS